jgi:hypothetical protein
LWKEHLLVKLNSSIVERTLTRKAEQQHCGKNTYS